MHHGKCASGDMSGYHESRQQQLRQLWLRVSHEGVWGGEANPGR